MAIAQATLIENVWQSVYDLIRANITDPANRGFAHNGKWIFTSFPDAEGTNFPNYPILLIDSIDFSGADVTYGSIKVFELSIPISIYTKSLAQLDTLTSQILNILNTNRTTLQGLGLMNYRVNGGTVSTDIRDNKKYHLKEFEIVFDWGGN